MISTPTILLDENRCRRNINRMVEKAKRLNLDLRPHFKTHQSREIGLWFKEYGVNKITVSSIDMAEYFAPDWNDITVAFPINILEIDKVNKLASSINLNLLVESKEVISYLNQHLTQKVGVFVKIDVGTNRTGVSPHNLDFIDELITSIYHTNNLNFKGFLAHAGHTYQCKNETEINDVHNKVIDILSDLKSHFIDKYSDLIISLGDTPACSKAENFIDVDEIRPGNFVFYDVTQSYIGSCSLDDIAVAMACPVVSVHHDRNELTVYGGGIHFSKDRLETPEYATIFGLAVEKKSDTWGDVIPNVYMRSLSQEHGIIKGTDSFIQQVKPGDIVYVLPVHSCMTTNLMKSFLNTSDRKLISGF